MKTKPFDVTLALVSAALAPTQELLRAEYQRQLTEQANRVLRELEEDGWDAQKRYAFPTGTYSRRQYVEGRARYELMTRLTDGQKASRSFFDPNLRKPKTDIAERIAEQAAKLAKDALEGYCLKLAGKITALLDDGATVKAVTYEGGLDPWGYSHVVVDASDRPQRWRTRMIINVSCLGKLFNQWPTRLIP